MIIYQNSFIKLDYDPSTDILSVDMPTVNLLNYTEVQRNLETIVEHIINYNVKKLLIDARKTEVEVDEESYLIMVSAFRQKLLETRVQKVARIVTSSTVRERVVQKAYTKQDTPSGFESFTEVAPAIAWLLQEEQEG